MRGTAVFLASSVLAASALVGVSVGAAQEPDPGERIMNASCQTSCHNVRPIQTQAMDAAAWTKNVQTMVDKGAKISKDDIPVLVRYLSEHFGPIPDGPGKEIVLNTCTMCHDLNRIKLGRRSSDEWEETLISMLNEGAPLSDEAFGVVHAYLSKNFGVE
jgi:cytochrome c5